LKPIKLPFQVELTAASERVLAAATHWSRPGQPISFPELLMGMLAEPELRGAALLAEHGVDADAIRKHWPDLQPRGSNGQDGEAACNWARELHMAMREAAETFGDLKPPLALASEHLLLGILIRGGDAAEFLTAHGFDPQAIIDATCKQYELSQEPIEWDGFDTVEPAASSTETSGGKSIEAYPVASATSNGAAPVVPPIKDAAAATVPLAVWRVLDAAANRAREAARVLEDYCRFALDDRHLTEAFKTLRHELAAALAVLPAAALAAGRNTQADVGTTLTAEREAHRGSLDDVVAANSKRLQESLRSLEEYGKLVDASVAATCKALRYRSYTLERAVQVTANSRQRLATAQLYVLLDGRETPQAFEALTRQLIEAGVDVIQLRDKRLDDRTLLERARQLRALTAGTPTLFIMNDRPDLAVLAEADGVHVGQEELPVAQVRRIVGPEPLVGLSTHNIEQAQAAVLDGADYIGVGPTFPSGTKQFESFAGLEYVRQVAAQITLPAFVIGGVTLENLDQVLAAGARRVAVAGGIVSQPSPGQAARAFLDKLRAYPPA